jgi:hypothetical protein
MTCPANSPFAFTQLTEPQQYASPTGIPAGFDTEIALLLGNCCNLTYSQFASGATSLTAAQIAGLWSGNSLSQLGAGFTTSEAIAAGAEIGTTGEYVTFPVGFALTGSIPGRPPMNIIALRGTRTYNEWIDDAEAIPASWHVGTNDGKYYYSLEDPFQYGMVHGGFYTLYNQGTGGSQPTSSGILGYSYSRPTGSIAQQIYSLLTGGSPFDSTLPLYITGHSLGAALATLCAMDVGINMPGSFPSGQLYMYNLASPLVAAGISAYGIGVETSTFVSAYNTAVANSYRVVHVPDIVPIMPPSCTDLSSEVELTFAHVTGNVVNFSAQTGSIGGNHACTDTYVPYLQQLFRGF